MNTSLLHWSLQTITENIEDPTIISSFGENCLPKSCDRQNSHNPGMLNIAPVEAVNGFTFQIFLYFLNFKDFTIPAR